MRTKKVRKICQDSKYNKDKQTGGPGKTTGVKKQCEHEENMTGAKNRTWKAKIIGFTGVVSIDLI